MPTSEDAVWTVLRHDVRRIMEGPLPVQEAVRRLWEDFSLLRPSLVRAEHDINALAYSIYSWDEFDDTTHPPEVEAENQRVLQLAREWNRSHSRSIDTKWLTPNVVDLAKAADADRAFDRLPILADALEDAGCPDGDLLDHCRQQSDHTRDCWVLDLILSQDR